MRMCSKILCKTPAVIVFISLFLLATWGFAQQGAPQEIQLKITELKPPGSTLYTFIVRHDLQEKGDIQFGAWIEGEDALIKLITLRYSYDNSTSADCIAKCSIKLSPGDELPSTFQASTNIMQVLTANKSLQGMFIIRKVMYTCVPVLGCSNNVLQTLTIPMTVSIRIPKPSDGFSLDKTEIRVSIQDRSQIGRVLDVINVMNRSQQRIFFEARVLGVNFIVPDYARPYSDIAPLSSEFIPPGGTFPIPLRLGDLPRNGQYSGKVEIRDAFGQAVYVPLNVEVQVERTFAELWIQQLTDSYQATPAVFWLAAGGIPLLLLLLFFSPWNRKEQKDQREVQQERVHEVAKELEITPKEVLDMLRESGVENKKGASVLTYEELLTLFRTWMQKDSQHREIQEVLLRYAQKHEGIVTQKELAELTKDYSAKDVLDVLKKLQDEGHVKKEWSVYVFYDFIDS